MNLKPAITRPVDFFQFWDKTSKLLARTPLELVKNKKTTDADPEIDLEYLEFNSFDNKRISGYLLKWKDEKERPLVIHSHGYMSQTTIQWNWAQSGINVLGVDIRGFGMSKKALPDISKNGYVLSGIDSPETSVLRGAVCDYIQAISVGRQLCEGKISTLAVKGISFGGGLALMAEAQVKAADYLILGVPTFGWAEGRQFYVQSGSGREINEYLKDNPNMEEDTMLVLRYFDPINFAQEVKCRTFIGLGLIDKVVPPQTVYSIVNHISGPTEIMELPVSHSNDPEEILWKKFEKKWIQMVLNGK
ncbi:MAG TPA: acetylxylan esterase [Cyclobacteriaceae bacterium]